MNEVAPIEKSKVVTKVQADLKAGGGVAAIVPQDAEQAYRMAQLIAQGGMAPKGMEAPEKIVTAILTGLEVGLKPMQAVQSIAVVNGRPCVWGDAALGLVQGSGLLEDIAETLEGEGEAMRAACRVNRKGNATPIERAFTVADAKTAGLWNKAGPWTQYPQRMLQMRARSWALRDGFADVLKGLHIYEEVRDYSRPVVNEASEVVTAKAIIDQSQNDAPPAEPEKQLAAPEPADLSEYRIELKGNQKDKSVNWGAFAEDILTSAVVQPDMQGFDNIVAANGDSLAQYETADPAGHKALLERLDEARAAFGALV